jgi:hypothetical protein
MLAARDTAVVRNLIHGRWLLQQHELLAHITATRIVHMVFHGICDFVGAVRLASALFYFCFKNV